MSQQQPMHYVHVQSQPYIDKASEAVLLARLRAQVEFYFSPQNLSRDTFLRSLLNSTEHIGAVPVDVIAKFPKVRELYGSSIGIQPTTVSPPADPKLIQTALENSQVVTISEDGKWISPRNMPRLSPIQVTPGREATPREAKLDSPPSPNSQTTSTSSAGVPTAPIQSRERTTVIVRELPEDCTTEEISSVFTTNVGPPKNVRLDVGNTWYITFATENEAIAAVAQTRDKEIRKIPVRARIKSEIPSVPPSPLPPQRKPPMSVPPTTLYGMSYPYGMPQPGFAPFTFPRYGMPMSPQTPVGIIAQPQVAIPYPPFEIPPGSYPPQQIFMNGPIVGHPPNGIPGVIPVDVTLRNQKKRQKQKRPKERSRGSAHTDWRQRIDKTEDQLDDFRRDGQRTDYPYGNDKRGSGYRRRRHLRQDSQRSLNSDSRPVPVPQQQPHAYSESAFPALAGEGESKSRALEVEKKHFGGYAQALLKKASKPERVETEDAATNEIQVGVEQLNLSPQQSRVKTTLAEADDGVSLVQTLENDHGISEK